MLPAILGLLTPLLGKIVDTVGNKLGVDMDSDGLKEKKLEISQEINKMLHEQDMKALEMSIRQIDVNMEEAKNPNRKWVTWRELLGYICAFAVMYHFIIQQFMAFIFSAAGHPTPLPELEMSGLMTILSAMLGVHFVDSRYNSPQGTDPELPVRAMGETHIIK